MSIDIIENMTQEDFIYYLLHEYLNVTIDLQNVNIIK